MVMDLSAPLLALNLKPQVGPALPGSGCTPAPCSPTGLHRPSCVSAPAKAPAGPQRSWTGLSSSPADLLTWVNPTEDRAYRKINGLYSTKT
ncbi:hypothetical protein SRHO_G00092280 [Serrasalmus rhombeus]